jgi:hypothetical protein
LNPLSWPGLSRHVFWTPKAFKRSERRKNVDGRDKPGHDEAIFDT